MRCDCSAPDAPRVQTLDGERCNVCPDWMRECEARWILRMPTREQRREYLDGAARKRGQNAVERLKSTIIRVAEDKR